MIKFNTQWIIDENWYEIVNWIDKNHWLKEFTNFVSMQLGTIKRWIKNQRVDAKWQIDILYFLKKKNIVVDEKLEAVLNKFDNPSIKDEYYTKSEIAKDCIKELETFLDENKIAWKNFTWIDCSVGNGAFFDNFDKDVKKIGIEIAPTRKDVLAMNYLDYLPNKNNDYLVCSNVPFGVRGNLALRFVNHSTFAKIIAVIVPQFFLSDGKGNLKDRINKSWKLVYQKEIPPFAFYSVNGEIDIKSVFLVFAKSDMKIRTINDDNKKVIDDFLKDKVRIYSISTGKITRNIKMIGHCDFYLSSSTYGKENCKMFDNFDDVRFHRGYGIKLNGIDKNKLKDINFLKYSYVSSNQAINTNSTLIKKAIYEKIKTSDS